MATKDDLLGSFGSLLDTLRQRLDPFQPGNVFREWLGMMNRAAGIARDAVRWQRLDSDSPAFDPVVTALDEATRALVIADFGDAASVLAALSRVDAALDALERLF